MTGSQTLIPNKGGRPVEFGPELRIQLLDLLMAGRSNGEACELVGISRDTLHRTIAKDTAFREAYQQAKVLSVDTLIDEADRLADMALKVESGAQAAGIKIALDHAWRKASRIAPQRWGERPAVAVVVNEISGDQEVAKRLAFLQALEACEEVESGSHPSLVIEP
jgi:hypothetical protein